MFGYEAMTDYDIQSKYKNIYKFENRHEIWVNLRNPPILVEVVVKG